MRADLLQAHQPRQLGDRLAGELAHAAGGAPGGAEARTRDPTTDRPGQLDRVSEPVADRRSRGYGATHLEHRVGQLPVSLEPSGPGRNRRPRHRIGLGTDHQPEVSGRQRQLVDLGSRRGAADRADPGRRGDLIDGADDREDRAGDVGERKQALVDHKPSLEHPVVRHELADEVRQRRPGPGHPAIGIQEPALALAREQSLAIVQLKDELGLAAQRLDGIQQPKAVAAGPGRQRSAAEQVGQQVGGADRQLLGQPERHPRARVDWAAERDQRSQAVVAAVGRGLIAEHPALGIAGEMDVGAGRLAHPVDRVGHRQHVVCKRALKPTGLALGRPEVDHPRIGAAIVQQADRAGGRRHVVDLGGEHQRRHQQDRGSGGGPPRGSSGAAGTRGARPLARTETAARRSPGRRTGRPRARSAPPLRGGRPAG